MTSIDVTDWEAADEEWLGTKPKQWLRNADDELWLWKESRDNRDAEGRSYRKGDDWSEVIAGRLGEQLGLPVARVELARRGDLFGVVSRRVNADDLETLVHGNELLAELGLAGRHPHDRTGYTLDAVDLVLENVAPPIEHDVLRTAFDWFGGYLLLDGLVGNTDRHQDNWAVLRRPERDRLAPSFDHASCLGYLLSDGERRERLFTRDAGRSVGAFSAHARSKFEGAPSLQDLACEALLRVSPASLSAWAAALDSVPTIVGIVEQIEKSRMSTAARDFALALYRHNHASLSHRLRTMTS